MAKRKSIHIKGMEHGAPIPNGVVIGNMIFSSAISGKDAKTGVLSPNPDEHDRPARHATKTELRGDNLFQIEVIAVL